MKSYTVVWWPPAESDLAELWLASAVRQPIADAANSIERLLADSPQDAGESGAEGFRRLFVSPLFVEFSVLEADRLVRIVSVRQST